MNTKTLARVISCIAATTRYPTRMLVADADLENDLGIESVKRVEIVAALAEEFGLDLESEQRDSSIRTIADVATWIDGFLNRNGSHQLNSQPIEGSVISAVNGDRVHTHHTSPRQTAPSPHYPKASLHDEPETAKPLEGRVALVTGSGRGIGRTIARLLAARGATIVVNSFHSRDAGDETTEQIRSLGGRAVHMWGSVANPKHVDTLFEEIDREFGYLDILVCNASDGRIGSFSELSWDDWDRAFRTNVSGHHQCAMRAARLMQPRGGGSIVTMSAVGAHEFIEGLGSQGVVKAAVETLTRYLACELSRFGVRANCVAGGPVYGDLISKFPAARATQNHWESITPDGELSSPMDLAETIAFLVSDRARGINGAVWMVDHGFSARADGRPIGGQVGLLCN